MTLLTAPVDINVDRFVKIPACENVSTTNMSVNGRREEPLSPSKCTTESVQWNSVILIHLLSDDVGPSVRLL